jgi:hypothetical protein
LSAPASHRRASTFNAPADGFHQSLIILQSLSSRGVQEALALLNVSAAERSRRVRNAAVSIAYNTAVRPALAPAL